MRAALALLAGALALGAAPARAADGPAFSYTRFHLDTVLKPTGQAEQTLAFEARANTEAGARQLAVQVMPFTDTMETASLVAAELRHADGQVVTLAPATAVVESALPGGQPPPGFEDRKRLVLRIPGIGPGDTLAVTWRKRIDQPAFPGRFALTVAFARTIGWADTEISVTAPAAMTIAAEASGVANESRTSGESRVLRWTYSSPGQAQDPAVLSPLDRLPRLLISTFPDWATFGTGWGAMAWPAAAPTDAVRAKATEIADGIKDNRGVPQAVYAWLQRNIRVVPVPLCDGPCAPATAETTLSRGLGDSKDIAVLAVALLAAKDIAAEPELLNAGTLYATPKVATFGTLDHAIVHVDEGDVRFDPTATGTPYGSLPLSEYGKTALRIGKSGASLVPVGVLADHQAGERNATTLTLGADGRITGETVNEAVGPFAGDLRRIALAIRAAGGPRAAAMQLSALGSGGNGTFAFADPMGVTPTFRVLGRFELRPQGSWLDGNAFSLPTGLRLVHRPGDVLLGPLSARTLPASEPTPCFSGREDEEISLTLPPGRHLAALPKGMTLESAAFGYRSTWTQDGGRVTVHRVLESRIAVPVCADTLRAGIAEALPRIRRDLDTQIRLAP